jgi:beta-N-acetylhexosaminidase
MNKVFLRLFILLVLFSRLHLVSAQAGDSVSLDKMIGQMVMVGLNKYKEPEQKGATLQAIKEGKISGIILFEKDLEKSNTKENLARLVWELQEESSTPLFVAIDEEGGKVNRLKPKYGFPRTVTAEYLGELNNLDSTTYYAEATATNLRNFGFNVNFAPTVDVDINPDNPVIGGYGRSYASDPWTVAAHAEKVIDAHDAQQVATVLKHFPGHGSSASDTHLGIADVSNTWQFEELFPYRALLDSGKVKAIMSSHIVNRSLDEALLPATLSNKIIDGILRKHLGFDGVVFSDDMHMGAITQHYGFEDAVVLAVNAGVDVLVFSNNITLDEITSAGGLHGLIKEAVTDGRIEEKKIRDSYARIMRLKSSLGLLKESYKSELREMLNMN